VFTWSSTANTPKYKELKRPQGFGNITYTRYRKENIGFHFFIIIRHRIAEIQGHIFYFTKEVLKW